MGVGGGVFSGSLPIKTLPAAFASAVLMSLGEVWYVCNGRLQKAIHPLYLHRSCEKCLIFRIFRGLQDFEPLQTQSLAQVSDKFQTVSFFAPLVFVEISITFLKLYRDFVNFFEMIREKV